MAAPSYTTDLTDIYTDTDNFVTVGGGRVTAVETDDYIQGNNCWSHDPFSSGIEGGMYDATTAPTITADDAVFIWTKCDVAATLATHAAGGIQVIMGTSSNAYDCFYVLGSDDYQYGGWKCIPVDPTSTPSTSVGSPGTYDHFGVRWNVPGSGAAKGYPMKIDAIRYGRQLTVTAGDATTPANWEDLALYDATSTRQLGICQPNASGVEIQGIINWGTSSTSTYFEDETGLTVIIIDTEWTSTDFTKIVIDNASTTFNLNGATIKALGTNNRGQLVFNNASTTSALSNNNFDGIGITTLRAGVTSLNNKWKTTDTVTQNGATITDCTFDNLFSTTSLVVDDISLVTGCQFNSDGSNHAVEINAVGTGSMTWDNRLSGYVTGTSGNNVTTGSTGNEAIYLNFTSSATYTINVESGATVPSVRKGTGFTGQVNVIAGAVSMTVNAVETDGTAVTGARVFVETNAGTGSLPYQDSVSITRSGSTATVTHTGHGLSAGDKVVIRGADQTEYVSIFTISNVTTNTYDITVSGTPATPATGSPVASFVFISGTVDGNGQISSTARTLATNQAVKGTVRKGSGSPLYKSSTIVGIISSTNGLDTTAVMIPDE